jgi:integrase
LEVQNLTLPESRVDHEDNDLLQPSWRGSEETPFFLCCQPRLKRFLSMEDEKRLLEKLGLIYGPWARLAILTGLRQSEQFRLQWKDVDLERGMLTLLVTKAGGVQYAPLNEEARTILGGFDSWQRSKWVFPSENPATALDVRNFYNRVWLPALAEAGIEWTTWHDLRHTFASRLAMNGQNQGTIATFDHGLGQTVCPPESIAPEGSS